MKRKTVTILLFLLAAASIAAASGKGDRVALEDARNHFKFYGFVRNYFTIDTRGTVSGTGNLFFHRPMDIYLNDYGDDLNQRASFRFLSLTTRLGVDVYGYQIGRTKFGAKVETDFYSGLSGSSGTAQLRLRQAYATILWDDLSLGRQGRSSASVLLTLGQTWHPLSKDQPHVTCLEVGAPFNPFSRTPLVQMDASLGSHVVLTAAALWQMQYQSTGPSGNSADYIKYACTPEGYLGLTLKTGGFLAKLGASVLSIKPRIEGLDGRGVEVKVSDRITTVNPYLYLQFTHKSFQIKGKTVYSQAGEHLYLMSGYGITDNSAFDGHYEYAPLQASSSWISASYGKKWQFMLMAGYIKCLGATKDLLTENGQADPSLIYFNSNGAKNLNSMWRVIPTVAYNIGKFSISLEYNVSAAQYGDGASYNSRGLSTGHLHWVYNHRIQSMVKFTF